MARLLLIVPSSSYRAAAFVGAADRLGVELVVACDRRQTMAGLLPDRFLQVDLADSERAAESIVERAATSPFDAIVAADDGGALAAARASEILGLRGHPPAAVAATRDKATMRRLLAVGGVAQPEFAIATERSGTPLEEEMVRFAEELGYPVVVKPATLAGSRGVIRADDPDKLVRAIRRIRMILDGRHGDSSAAILLERYVDGEELALEGLCTGGNLEVLALFDKPDPLVGPYFEETIYVTPSRHHPALQARIVSCVASTCRAIGLQDGPVHAEVRVGPGPDPEQRPVVLIEAAARTIGGRCAKALRFSSGESLEQVVLAQALGIPARLNREQGAAGVMMLPIPRSGRLRQVTGIDVARAHAHVTGVEITIPLGRRIEALPEGDRYLGFLFARADEPVVVETALRDAYRELGVVIEPVSSGLVERSA